MRQRGLNKLSNALLYGEYKGDALIGGNLSKSPTVTTLLLTNTSSSEQPNILYNLLGMCNNVIFETIDILSIITEPTSE